MVTISPKVRSRLPHQLLAICVIYIICGSFAEAQTNRKLSVDYLNRGTKELDAGNLDEAVHNFNRAIELDRNFAAPYFSRGLVRKR